MSINNKHQTNIEQSLNNNLIEEFNINKYKLFEKFNYNTSQHYTKEIGENKNKDNLNYDRTTFTSVLLFIDVSII